MLHKKYVFSHNPSNSWNRMLLLLVRLLTAIELRCNARYLILFYIASCISFFDKSLLLVPLSCLMMITYVIRVVFISYFILFYLE